MNTYLRRLGMGLMAVLLAMTFTLPAYGTIQYDKTVTAYLRGTGQSSYAYINVSGYAKGKGIVKKSVKSSNAKVARADTVSDYGRVFNKISKYGDDYSNYSGDIELALLKPGTSKVSYKVGSKSYTTTVKVLKYVNPLKSLVISGVNNGKSIAGKFKSSASVSGKGGNKAGKIAVTAASGWKITHVSYDNYASSKSWDYAINNGTGVSKATLSVPVKIGKGYIYISLVNTKTKGTLTVGYAMD